MKRRKTAVLLALGALLTAGAWVGERAACWRQRSSVTRRPQNGGDGGVEGGRTLFCVG